MTMPRGRTLFWTSIGIVVAAVAVVIAWIELDSGTPASPAPPGSTRASTKPPESAPVVVPKPSGTSSFSYLSDLNPSGDLSELVNRGPVKISGSIYPKSLSFYCNVGDPTPFPVYTLKHNARRFQATIGLAVGSPSQFQGIIRLIGDGRTLRTFSVSVVKPKPVDLDVTGIHRLQLECFGSGNSYTGGEAVGVAWGNARFSG
jgi:NPCBM/NEW2 domain-containing protein